MPQERFRLRIIVRGANTEKIADEFAKLAGFPKNSFVVRRTPYVNVEGAVYYYHPETVEELGGKPSSSIAYSESDIGVGRIYSIVSSGLNPTDEYSISLSRRVGGLLEGKERIEERIRKVFPDRSMAGRLRTAISQLIARRLVIC